MRLQYPVLCLILFLPAFWGCRDETPGDEPRPVGEKRSLAEEALERLRSLGYVSWDQTENSELRGVTKHDKERTQSGYNIYTNDVDRAYLMDLEGEILHTWHFDGKRNCQYVELQDNGDVVAVCVKQSFTRLDWHSNVIFDVQMAADHDFAVLPDGSYLVAFLSDARNYKGRSVVFDGVAHVSADGSMHELDWWSAFERLDELRRHHARSPLDFPPPQEERGKKHVFDYYHLNTLEVLPETPLGKRDPRFRAGNYLICLRNVNLIAVLDQVDFSVAWSFGERELDMPHMPTMLPNGNILVFDNGKNRKYSRVLEIAPQTGEIVWEYKGDPPESFYSELRGGVQRLENGNTLICDSERGRVFEVTPDGETVWEFWNPEVVKGKRKRIYRFHRLSPSAVEPLLERSTASSRFP